MMKEIKVERIMETSYEDGTNWVEYKIGNRWGYEITEEVAEGDEGIYQSWIDSEKVNTKNLVEKINIENCSIYLAEIIENCRQSDNEMWFVEFEDLEEVVGTTEEDVIENFLLELQEETIKLGIEDYVNFNEDDCAITVYGGVITKFLF